MIWDTFLFFNELEILDIRLHTLAPYVDKFVLVEANETFSGNPKPLYYLEHQERFSEFWDKIVYVMVDDLPKTDNFWAREGEQRNAIMRGLTDASPDDMILISDVDEIPRPERFGAMLEDNISIFVMDYYMYYLNMRSADEALWFLGTRSVPMSRMTTPQDIRNWGAFRQPLQNRYAIFNAGWHFSYLGGPKQVQYKLESTSESQLPTRPVADFDNIDSITKRIATGKDVLGLRNHHWMPVPLDETYPKYVLENQDLFSDLIFAADGAK
jgi:hypothetical protein